MFEVVETKFFKRISPTEYELQINGRTKALKVSFGKTEALFKAFISNGGIIDPSTGEVQTDLISLIASFKEVGNILLTDYDDYGKVVEEGNCAGLASSDVVALFTLATHVIEDFIKGLDEIRKMKNPDPAPDADANPEA